MTSEQTVSDQSNLKSEHPRPKQPLQASLGPLSNQLMTIAQMFARLKMPLIGPPLDQKCHGSDILYFCKLRGPYIF